MCAEGNQPGKGCNVACNQLLNDNISDDISCIKTIYKIGGGFKAWVAYNNYCSQGSNNQYINGCNV
ncbi:hypothetical protein NQ314_013667 [Rhamnusium bicolor]|uniref:lysozyme n=1 Tax=Rhamnusium bicolor TaxID=1586634 RepID=A0AAV8X5V8_9CUCU|nr:hypothetical protein NQ314_013667 [Rhamnusium bicolor]